MNTNVQLALRQDPIAYSHLVLQTQYIVPKLREAVKIMLENKRVYVRSGHGVGKSFLAANLALWFYSMFPGSITYTTAPTQRQVRDILWKEIHSLYGKSTLPIAGTLNTLDLSLSPDHFIKGFASNQSVAYQGRHAKYLFWIIDEADGLESELLEAIESTTTGDTNFLFYIGNPVDPDSHFRSLQDSRPDLTVHVSSYESPNIVKVDGDYSSDVVISGCATLGWIEEKALEWGENSNVFKSRILAEYPSATPDALLTEDECLIACGVKPKTEGWVILGVDVAYQGDDKSVITALSGNSFFDTPFIYSKLNGSQLKNEVVKIQRKFDAMGRPIKAIVYDSAGVATAFGEQIESYYSDKNVIIKPVNFASKVTEWRVESRDHEMDRVENKRAEMYLDFRRAIVTKKIRVPAPYELKTVMPKIKYKINTKQNIQIEEKQQFKKRFGHSPDIVDAAVLAYHGYVLGLHQDSRGHEPIVTGM